MSDIDAEGYLAWIDVRPKNHVTARVYYNIMKTAAKNDLSWADIRGLFGDQFYERVRCRPCTSKHTARHYTKALHSYETYLRYKGEIV